MAGPSCRPRSRIAMFAAGLLSVSLVAACGNGSSSSGGNKAGKQIVVGYILTAPVEALEAIGAGLKIGAKKYNMKIIEESANFSSDTQISAMQALEAKNVDVIITAPLVPNTFFAAAQVAKNKGIKVMTYDRAGPGVTLAVTNPDEQEAASMVGQLAKELKTEGKPCELGIINGQPTAGPLKARDDGFAAGAKTAGCHVLATQVATQTTTTEGATIANAWKTTYGSKMTGIVSANDEIALGALNSRKGGFNPLIIGFNGESAAVKAVANGSLWADAGLENAVMGEGLAYGAYQAATGHAVPPAVSSPYYVITKDTAATFTQQYADSTIEKLPPLNISFGNAGGQPSLEFSR
jgi:ABC-type sugar transport system substrate-binding protein